jgi:hypothetical protein
VKWIPGEHKVPGGGFPLPPLSAELCQILPPPTSFNGPFVIVDRLIEIFNKMDLPEEFPGSFTIWKSCFILVVLNSLEKNESLNNKIALIK